MPIKLADVETQYKLNKDLKKEDVINIQEWIRSQPHLPPISELEVQLFLYSCYCSNEATKQCIENYYTVRRHCPEFFANLNVQSKEIQQIIKTLNISIIPNLTPEGYAIFYAQLNDLNPDVFVFNACLKVFDMNASLYLHENGLFQGHVIIIDLLGCSLSHLLRISPLSLKKFLYYLQDALPVRLKSFHFTNAPSFMDTLLGMMKPFLKEEFMKVLFIHQPKSDTIFKIIPKECLPEVNGGTLGPIADLHAATIKCFMDNGKFFIDSEKFVVDETKRLGKPKTAGDLFGVEGTFKKLDID